MRVDAAGQGIYRAWHRESMNDALRDLRDHRAAAVIVSIARCDATDLPRVARVVREYRKRRLRRDSRRDAGESFLKFFPRNREAHSSLDGERPIAVYLYR